MSPGHWRRGKARGPGTVTRGAPAPHASPGLDEPHGARSDQQQQTSARATDARIGEGCCPEPSIWMRDAPLSAVPRDGLSVLHQVPLWLMASVCTSLSTLPFTRLCSACAHNALKELLSMCLAGEVLPVLTALLLFPISCIKSISSLILFNYLLYFR